MRSLVGLRRSLTILSQANRAGAAKESVEICPVEHPGAAPATFSDRLEPALHQQLADRASSLEAAILCGFLGSEQCSKNGNGDVYLRVYGRVGGERTGARGAVRVVAFGAR